jgi:uncharacterized protein HemX
VTALDMTEPEPIPRNRTFEAAKATSNYLLPYVLALAGMLYALGEIQRNRNTTVVAYQSIESKINIALTRQEEVVSRLRKIEQEQTRMREAVDRLTEKYAPRPE